MYTIDVVGQGASMVTGGMMAGGIGGFTLFANMLQPTSQQEPAAAPGSPCHS